MPAALHTKRFLPTALLQPGWKSIVTTLGILSLLGAGPLNRSDEFIWPTEGILTSARHDVEGSFDLARNSPAMGLQETADWARHNFPAEGLPMVNDQWTIAPQSPELANAARNIHRGQSLLRAQKIAAEAPTQEALVMASSPELETPKRARKMFQPNLIAGDAHFEKMSLVMTPAFASSRQQPALRWERLALVEAGSLGLTVFGFRKFDEFFGSAQRPFRAGSDWSKDHTLHFDELIHFQGGYRIAQGLIGMYRWAGLNATWSECLGAGTAASVMTALEYIDGRRPKPKQGASYSDFAANLLGVGFALAKLHINALQDVDLRLNYTSFGDVFHKRTLLKYDRMTHWLTYDLQRQLNLPLHLGVGYGVQNAFKPNVSSEFYLGFGLTPVDILERYYPAAAKPLAWLNIYHIGWQMQIK
jgi:hypothetical protein